MNDNIELVLLVIALIVTLIILAVKLNKANQINTNLDRKISDLSNQNDNLKSENSRLIADNALLEAEHLKFQLQPHTLGNVVTTLNAIAKNLHRGTESLAESLNYILYKGNTHLVTVEEEINFIKKYIQLNQLLYSDIISTSIDDSQVSKTSKFYTAQCIPHLISAYLVENAYKHGDKTHPDFLKIVLKLSDFYFEMTVVNRLNAKPTENQNGGLGLKNMEKRLELLLNDKYEIKRNYNEQEYHSTLIIRF
jgi:two-component system, LytTR family, sensor kinase